MGILRTACQEFRWASYRLSRRARGRIAAVRRAIRAPRLPVNEDGGVLVHLGCGEIDSPGYVNVDAQPAPHIHYVSDVTDLSMFPADHADLVYACHVLEHTPHPRLRQTLWEWWRILKPGGVLRLAVPDFEAALRVYEASDRAIEPILPILMGTQADRFKVHHALFNEDFLACRLREVGFSGVRRWTPDEADHHDFEDWSGAVVRVGDEEIPISLNLEGVK